MIYLLVSLLGEFKMTGGNTCSFRKSVTDLVLGAHAANAVTETEVTVTGAAVGDVAVVGCRAALSAGLALVAGRVSAANKVQVCIANLTAAPIDPADTFDFDIEIIRGTGVSA
jgi:hypothetical protein